MKQRLILCQKLDASEIFLYERKAVITHLDTSPSTDELSTYGHIVGLLFLKKK